MELHANLLGTTRTLLQSCGYKVKLIFVRGHQDTRIPMVLAQDAWLNIEADALAKDKASTPHVGPECYKLPGNAWVCYADNRHLLKQFDESLRTHINGQELQCYWEKRKAIHPTILSWVDWSAIGANRWNKEPVGRCNVLVQNEPYLHHWCTLFIYGRTKS